MRWLGLYLLLVSCASTPQPQRPDYMVEAFGAYAQAMMCVEEETRPLAMGPAAFNVGTDCISLDIPWLKAIESRFGRSAAIGIVAHEVGHSVQLEHLGFVFMSDADEGIVEMIELEADRMAGCALARLKLTPKPMQSWLQAHETDDTTHGTLAERLEAIEAGWHACTDNE